MIRRLFAVISLGVAVVLLASPASAQEYPPEQEGVQVSDSTLAPGQPFSLSGCCIQGTGTVTFHSQPVVLGSVQGSPDDGSFSGQFTVPADATAGTHTITVSGEAFDGSGPVSYSTTVTVVAAAAPGGALPRTGDDSAIPLTRVAIMLVAVGSAFVIGARRRATTREAAQRVKV